MSRWARALRNVVKKIAVTKDTAVVEFTRQQVFGVKVALPLQVMDKLGEAIWKREARKLRIE